MTTIAAPDSLDGGAGGPAPAGGRFSRLTRGRARPNDTTTAVLLLLVSLTSLQFGAGVAVKLFASVGAGGASTLRLGLAAVVLLALTRPDVRAWSRQQWSSVLLLGLALGTMNGIFYHAIAHISLGIAVTIEFLGPLGLAAALSRRGRDFAWVLLALGGVLLLGLQTGGGAKLEPVGVILALAAGACWAGYILAGSRAAQANVGFGGLAVATAVATVLTLPFGLTEGGTALLRPHVLLVGLAVAVLASVIPYSCELAALARIPKKVFSVLLALEPAAAAIMGALLLGQHLSPSEMLGIAVVIAAGVGSTISSREPLPIEGAEIAD